MAINLNDLANALTGAQERPAEPRASRDQYGTIALDAQGTPTVMLDGGEDYAPCTCMVGVHHGDRVLAHVVNHKIVVFANITAPTTDDAQALVAIDRADAAAEAADKAGIAAASAQDSADKAATAAGRAQQSADDAATAAQTAWDHADDAATAASAAQSSADDAADAAAEADRKAVDAGNAAAAAQADATRANAAANSALIQASIVEDVAGTLRWIQEHGTYVATTDTTVQEGTVYFELKDGDYVPIVEPTGNPKAQGWYVLDITDSQTEYILAHLAVTSAGLWVLPSGLGSATGPQTAPGYKLLLASDSVKLYDAAGHIVTTYGESITFDSERPQRIGNDTAYVEYYDSDNDGTPDSIRIAGTNLNAEFSNFRQTVSETYATKSEAKQTDSDSGKREIVTEDAAELPLLTLTAYGECQQDGTPTPDAPVPIQCVRGRNLAPYLEQGYWAYADGAPVYSATWVRTPKIACTPGQTYTATASNNTYWCGFVYYDASGNFISTDNSKSHAKYEPVHYVSTAPANAAYMAFNINHNDSGNVGSLTPDEVTDFMLVRGGTACAYIPYGSIAIVSTAYEPYRESVSYIDLQGEELCSLSDGTEDVLTVDASGHVVINKAVAYTDQAETDGVTGTVGTDVLSSTGEISDGADVYYKAASSSQVNLGYIDMPTTFDGGTVHVDAEIHPVIDASWWTKAGYEAGKAYNDGNGSADLAALTERVTTAESSITQQAGQIALKANAADTYTKAQTDASLTLKANKATLTSEINASADTVKIDATRVNIEGAAIFTSGRLSQSSLDGAYDASGAASGAVNALKTDLASSTGTTVIDGGHIATDSLTVGHVSGLQGSLDGKASTGDVTTALNSAKAYTDAVEVGGKNLLLGTSDGWSDWVEPENKNNNTKYWYISRNDELTTWAAMDAQVTCSFEIEFSGVTASTGGSFRIYAQDNFKSAANVPVGAGSDTEWNNGAAIRAMDLTTPPADGVYRCTASWVFTNDHTTRYALQFTTRADWWASGKYRIRKVKYELGNKPTDWTPAPEDTDTAIEAASGNGYTVIWDSNYGTTYSGGEAVVTGYDPTTKTVGTGAGWVMWNGVKRTVPKKTLNPNAAYPYNIPLYLVLRLSSATATTGTVYLVWYNGGWKSGDPDASVSSAISAWTWAEATDIVLAKCVEPSGEAQFTETQIFDPPWTCKQVTSITVTAQSANANANNAAKTATNYITAIDSNGIKVHAANNPNSNYAAITADGMEVYKGGESCAAFGESTRIGKQYVQGASDNESHMELDYHSLKMVDKEGHEYLYVSDLRDANGEVDITDEFIGNGTTTEFELSLAANNTSYDVTVDRAPASNVTKTTGKVTFATAPASGAEIAVTYTTESYYAKAYTLGLRHDYTNIGACSFAEGALTTASGPYSHAEGRSTTASGKYSHAEGFFTDATYIASHAEGYQTEASGGYSHSEGSNTTASGIVSHAEGRSTTASGNWSHAEGYYAKASGPYSHAEGYYTTASGLYSHAEGYYAKVSGPHSHAQNLHTIASSADQTAIGRYNIIDGNGTYALIVGNGTSDTARSNAQAIRWNGLTDVAGRTAYPLFVYTTAPDEADLPVTPCFVLVTSDYGLWYYDGN